MSTDLDKIALPEDNPTGIATQADKKAVYDQEFGGESKNFIKIIQEMTRDKQGLEPGSWFSEGIEDIPEEFYALVVGHNPFRVFSIYNQKTGISLTKCVSYNGLTGEPRDVGIEESQGYPEEQRYGGDCFSCVQKDFVRRGEAPACTFIFNVDFYVRELDAVVTYGFKKGDLGRRGNKPGTLLQRLINSMEDANGVLQPFVVKLSVTQPAGVNWFVPKIEPVREIPEDFYSGMNAPLAIEDGIPVLAL